MQMSFSIGEFMKKFSYIFLSLFLLLSPLVVFADKIYDIKVDIYLDKDGNATFTEIWDVQASSGSEWYKQLFNLGRQELINFKVKMDGKDLEQKNWDVSEDINEKSGFYGINYVEEGLELCFGKSDMKRHQFTLTYTLSNVVVNASDSQVMYQSILSKASLEQFEVTVRSFYDFPDTLDVWGYGYKGYAYVKDGVIKMSNEEGDYLDNDYVVLLVKFPLETFNVETYDVGYENFDDFLEQAEEGSFEYDYGTKKNNSWIGNLISTIISLFVPICIIISAITFGSKSEYGTKRLKFSKDGKKLRDINYFRDIPFKKDIFKSYWLACNYGQVKKQTDFLGAILLKWLKDGNVENTTSTTAILKREVRSIKFINSDKLSDSELELYNMMFNASRDGILENNEFKRWCENNYQKIFSWFNKVIDMQTDKYVSEGKITMESKFLRTVYSISDEVKEDALKVAGLKKFLNEFSNIKDRESIEVKLWEDYLMHAQIFGIAKKVAKEFKNLYPDVITDDTYDNVIFIHTFSTDAVNAASSARSAAESYSAGGGGFSSGGGGGGSFGGGGSMGGR